MPSAQDMFGKGSNVQGSSNGTGVRSPPSAQQVRGPKTKKKTRSGN